MQRSASRFRLLTFPVVECGGVRAFRIHLAATWFYQRRNRLGTMLWRRTPDHARRPVVHWRPHVRAPSSTRHSKTSIQHRVSSSWPSTTQSVR